MSNLVTAVVEFGAVLILSYLGGTGVRYLSERLQILDVPNERSSHSRSVPRGGGLTIVILTLSGAWLYDIIHPSIPRSALLAYTIGALSIVTISWLDDVRSRPAVLRFAVHAVAAIIAIYWCGYLQLNSVLTLRSSMATVLGMAITFLWIVGLTNAYNFMDGIDGIAGGQALVASLGWAAIGFLSGHGFLAIFGLVLAASSLGFLFHNWPPARIFMGDVGSAFLGYTFAVLPLVLSADSRFQKQGLTPVVVGVLLLWPFVFDSTFTLLRRLRFGENVFKAHRSHLYQRLVILGYTHRAVSLLYAGLAVVGLVLVLAGLQRRNMSLMIAVILTLLCITLWALVSLGEHMGSRT